MSRVTTLTYQKFLLCISSQDQDLYTPKIKHVGPTFTGSHLRAVTDANDDDDDADNDNAGRHSTTTRGDVSPIKSNQNYDIHNP